MPFCFVCSGDNPEKIWVHQFLAKPKRIAAGGMEGDRGIKPPGGPWRCPGVGKAPDFFFVFVL